MSEREAILKLRLALAPFAILFQCKALKAGSRSKSRGEWFKKMPDHFPIELTITMGVCRQAVKALEETETL